MCVQGYGWIGTIDLILLTCNGQLFTDYPQGLKLQLTILKNNQRFLVIECNVMEHLQYCG